MVMQQRWLLVALAVALLIHVANCVTCYKCTTDKLNCPDETNTCDDTDQCYQLTNNGTVERGCFKDLTGDKTRCSDTDDKTCITCSTEKCNKDIPIQCFRCEGCDSEQKEVTYLRLCQTFDDMCYSRVADDKVQRGCVSEIKDFDKDCAKHSCKICNANSCNKQAKEKIPDLFQCLRCDSEKNPDCEAAMVRGRTCDEEEKFCVTRLDGNKLTRDCLKDATTCKADDQTCVTCNSTSNCNTIHWQKCHQCEGNDLGCTSKQTKPKEPSFCAKYKDTDVCYERVLQETTMQRGCESDAADSACKENQNCRTCDGDGCNSNELSSLKTSFRCLRCDTGIDKTGTCLLGTRTSEPCLQDDTHCYREVDQDGKLLKRGCMKERENKECTGTLCSSCNATSCNNGTFPTDRLRCYQCKTTDGDKSCAEALTGEPNSAFCKTYKSTDQCYTRIKGDVFERGCESTLGTDACQGLSEKECQRCTGENCNAVSEERLKNFAGRTVTSSLLVIFAPTLLALAAVR